MRRTILILAAASILISGCGLPNHVREADHEARTDGVVLDTGNAAAGLPGIESPAEMEKEGPLPVFLLNSYYLPKENPVYSYLQNKSIRRFFDMWFREQISEEAEAHWNYDTLAPVLLLDHDFKPVTQQDKGLYTCTFSTDDGRSGYIIVSYGEGAEGPYISKRSLHETTPYQYDLRANGEQIAEALKESDIDLSTASAARAEWIDTENNSEDRIILFTDGKGDRYICYFGDGDYTVRKQ